MAERDHAGDCNHRVYTALSFLLANGYYMRAFYNLHSTSIVDRAREWIEGSGMFPSKTWMIPFLWIEGVDHYSYPTSRGGEQS
jgi:hypothetical protein